MTKQKQTPKLILGCRTIFTDSFMPARGPDNLETLSYRYKYCKIERFGSTLGCPWVFHVFTDREGGVSPRLAPMFR